jgi:lysophospholipase L1-like esterase
MRQLAEQKGFSILFLGQVSVDLQGSGRAVCVYADTEHVPNIDLCAFWQAKAASAGQYFADPIHANATGHRMIADEILAALDGLGWVR